MTKSRLITGNRTAEDIIRAYELREQEQRKKAETYEEQYHPEKQEAEPEPTVPTSPASPIQVNDASYIILPSHTHNTYSYPDLLVAKARSHQNLEWNQAHQALHQQQASMLTIRQFVDFLAHLKARKVYDGTGSKVAKADIKQLLEDILAQRAPWRAEWLDALFTEDNGIWKIKYGHQEKKGKLVARYHEPLEACIREDCYVNLFSANKQGLPTRKVSKQEIYYWQPGNGTVARFLADSGRVCIAAGFGSTRVLLWGYVKSASAARRELCNENFYEKSQKNLGTGEKQDRVSRHSLASSAA